MNKKIVAVLIILFALLIITEYANREYKQSMENIYQTEMEEQVCIME